MPPRYQDSITASTNEATIVQVEKDLGRTTDNELFKPGEDLRTEFLICRLRRPCFGVRAAAGCSVRFFKSPRWTEWRSVTEEGQQRSLASRDRTWLPPAGMPMRDALKRILLAYAAHDSVMVRCASTLLGVLWESSSQKQRWAQRVPASRLWPCRATCRA